MMVSRRAFMKAGWSALLSAGAPGVMANGWLADVHSHFGFSMRTNQLSLRDQLVSNKVPLVSWAVVADFFLLQRAPSGRVITTRRSGPRELMAISRASAQKLAAKGGVIGIWPSLANYRSIEDYGDGIRGLIDEVGEDHLAFGTDMDGLGPFTLFTNHYDDLRRTSDYLASRSISEKTLEKISIGNYARLLRAALQPIQQDRS